MAVYGGIVGVLCDKLWLFSQILEHCGRGTPQGDGMEDLININEGFHRFSPTADINPRFYTSQISGVLIC